MAYKPMQTKFAVNNDLKFWPKTPSLLNGGLNLIEKEYKLPENQTPKVLNMWFKDGELSKRWGQDEKINLGNSLPVLQMSKVMFNGKIIMHSGDTLIEVDPLNL